MCALYTVPTDTVAVFQTAGVGRRSVVASPIKAFQDPAEDEQRELSALSAEQCHSSKAAWDQRPGLQLETEGPHPECLSFHSVCQASDQRPSARKAVAITTRTGVLNR
jgi:hypothetical protein